MHVFDISNGYFDFKRSLYTSSNSNIRTGVYNNTIVVGDYTYDSGRGRACMYTRTEVDGWNVPCVSLARAMSSTGGERFGNVIAVGPNAIIAGTNILYTSAGK